MEFLRHDLVQADGVLHVLEANRLGAPVRLQAVCDPVFLGAKILELQCVILAKVGEFDFWPQRKIGNCTPMEVVERFDDAGRHDIVLLPVEESDKQRFALLLREVAVGGDRGIALFHDVAERIADHFADHSVAAVDAGVVENGVRFRAHSAVDVAELVGKRIQCVELGFAQLRQHQIGERQDLAAQDAALEIAGAP